MFPVIPFTVFAAFVATVLIVGSAVRAASTRAQPSHDVIDLALALAFGFVALGLLGAVVWLTPVPAKIWVSGAGLVGLNACALVVHRRLGWPVPWRTSAQRIALAAWLSLSLLALTLAALPIRPPPTLPDGPYVYKPYTLAVRVQHLVGAYPTDNALPAFATEYMARDTPFSVVRPIMPGQEISNRPILAALINLPFRVMTRSQEGTPSPYPEMRYVGRSWPDTSVLISNQNFARSLAVLIPLNASLIVGFAALVAFFRVPHPALVLLSFGVLSPYAILHTVFTWPKNLAGFFIALAALELLRRNAPWRAGAMLGLAYWSHPYAIAFAAAFAGWLLFQLLRRPSDEHAPPLRLRGTLAGILAFALVVAPWFAWTHLKLQIPSDLLAQNVGAATSLMNFIWPRVYNLAALILPTSLLMPSFNGPAFFSIYLTNLASAVGAAVLLLLPWTLLRCRSYEAIPVVWLGLLPGCALVGAFGQAGMIPLLHGWQAVWPGVVAVTLGAAAGTFGSRFVFWASLTQVVINLVALGLRADALA